MELILSVMKNTPKTANVRSFYADSSTEYSLIPMPEGIGNISGEDASRGFGKNWSWTLSYPNNFTRWNSYEEKRNLVTKVDYLRPGSANYPAKVDYSYDSLGRPITRADYYNTPNPDISHSYSYNERSELTADAMTTGHSHSYSYDNIGNRVSAQESSHIAQHYSSNVDNQYSSITSEGGEAFLPEYDADGNQSKIRSSTGEWQVLYDANNRPIRFSQGSSKIECLYDYKGRRIAKKTYKDDSLVSSQCFVYDRYLQIAELDGTHATASQPPVLRKSYLWDPSEPEASRVLAQTLYNENGDYIEELYFCHDAQKNTTSLFGILGGRRALYEYGAYGLPLKSEGNAAESNPFRYSSEYHDTELGLIYYNYRHYNPSDGRWLTRDPIQEDGGLNLYGYTDNSPLIWFDYLGTDKRPAPRDPQGGRIPPASRPQTHFPKAPKPSEIAISSPLPNGVAGVVGGGIQIAGDIIGVVNLSIGNTFFEATMECRNKCLDYIIKEKLTAGCSCCSCAFHITAIALGQLKVLNYDLYSVDIYPTVDCEAEGWLPRVGLYLEEDDDDPLRDERKKRKTVTDPYTGKLMGIQSNSFNV